MFCTFVVLLEYTFTRLARPLFPLFSVMGKALVKSTRFLHCTCGCGNREHFQLLSVPSSLKYFFAVDPILGHICSVLQSLWSMYFPSLPRILIVLCIWRFFNSIIMFKGLRGPLSILRIPLSLRLPWLNQCWFLSVTFCTKEYDVVIV